MLPSTGIHHCLQKFTDFPPTLTEYLKSCYIRPTPDVSSHFDLIFEISAYAATLTQYLQYVDVHLTGISYPDTSNARGGKNARPNYYLFSEDGCNIR